MGFSAGACKLTPGRVRMMALPTHDGSAAVSSTERDKIWCMLVNDWKAMMIPPRWERALDAIAYVFRVR
jgi:hypothetical protein